MEQKGSGERLPGARSIVKVMNHVHLYQVFDLLLKIHENRPYKPDKVLQKAVKEGYVVQISSEYFLTPPAKDAIRLIKDPSPFVLKYAPLCRLVMSGDPVQYGPLVRDSMTDGVLEQDSDGNYHISTRLDDFMGQVSWARRQFTSNTTPKSHVPRNVKRSKNLPTFSVIPHVESKEASVCPSLDAFGAPVRFEDIAENGTVTKLWRIRHKVTQEDAEDDQMEG